MRSVPITTVRGGINRLKVKGSARADSLYDLVNAYINMEGEVQPREGTIRNATLTALTAGLSSFSGELNVFSNALQTVPAGYICNLLVHPTNAALQPTKIWFAKPFMGFLYVVAQFSNGDIFHYWLQNNGVWTVTTVEKTGTIVLPAALPNGLAFLAVRDMPINPNWISETVVGAGTVVEPTNYTGFAYRAVAVAGTTPHTGPSEPSWPTVLGGTIQEFGDFGTTDTSAAATQDTTSTVATPLGSTITDRYGNASTIINVNTATSGNASTTAAASTQVTTWAPGTNYAPGAVTRPTTNQGAVVNAIPNGDFEAGDDGSWVKSSGNATIQNAGGAYQGSYCAKFALNHSTDTVTMNSYGVVTPGQSVMASAYLNPNNNGADTTMLVRLKWYNSADTFISNTDSTGFQGFGYRKASVTGVAPAGAVHCRVAVQSATGTTPNASFADLVVWSLETPAATSLFLFEAVQAATGASGSTEPVWPTVSGNTVIDGAVTWKAIGTSIVTWQAIPIMQTGTVEPIWPTTIGNTVIDPSTYTSNDGHITKTDMSWQCVNRQVTDPKCPNTNAAALGASHVFNGSNDITSFSAVVNPTDWTSANNAGYLPTGLNNYGDNPVAVLALYRSNLVVFNSGGYQMWQIDPDPQNMDLLDAQPVGSIWPQAAQSVANDLLFLTEVGVRNLGTIGATANMAIGNTGQPVDPIVVKQLQLGTYQPYSLYYPGRGQYWLVFGSQAIVLTQNGTGQKAWARYTFPDTITDATLQASKLYLRTGGNLVWVLDALTLIDDAGGTSTPFTSLMQWPYLNAGALGMHKQLEGLDIVGDGQVTVQIAWREDDPTTFSDNAGFATSLNVTPPYAIAVADTVPGQPIPIGPMTAPSYSVILTWGSNQAWTWEASNLYLTDNRGGGAGG